MERVSVGMNEYAHDNQNWEERQKQKYNKMDVQRLDLIWCILFGLRGLLNIELETFKN